MSAPGETADRCPNCGRFVPDEADGFYDREWPYHDGATTLVFCDETCADQQRAKDRHEQGDAETERDRREQARIGQQDER